MKLRDLGEDRLLAEILHTLATNSNVIASAGDDCAVVKFPRGKWLLLKTDCVVEGIHFTSRTDPEAIGWKAMARPLSDFAAMSGVPQFAMITLVAPPTTEWDWIKKLYRGLNKIARKFDVAIVGGETSGAKSGTMISVSVAGYVERKRSQTRRGAKAGDDLFVTGRLGGSLRGKHLNFTPRIIESRWLTENFRIHAMMDLSDGLGADLPRFARSSKVGYEIDENRLPRNAGCSIEQAINDGEDFELLFAISPRNASGLQNDWRKNFPKLLLTRIGQVKQKSKIKSQSFRGFVHFK